MEELVVRIQAVLARGGVDEALAMASVEEARAPAHYEVAMAAIAAHRHDATACLHHAERARRLAPTSPAPLEFLAVGHLLRDEPADAERYAQSAVDAGGGRRSLGGLANLLLANRKPGDAERVYRRVLASEPADVQALSGVASARFAQGDAEGGTTFFARAFDANPFDASAIRSVMNAYADAGKLLGTIAFANLIRDKFSDDETTIFLDVLQLQLTRLLLHSYPPASLVADADEVVARLVKTSARRSPRVQVGIARALVDVQRLDEAAQIAERLDALLPGETALRETDRASLLFLHGIICAARNDESGALAAYLGAVETDPRQWEACTNAVSILLERHDESATVEIARLLSCVPASVKSVAPQLLFNEAIYFRRVGRSHEARKNLEAVIAGTRGEGELAQLARRQLEEG